MYSIRNDRSSFILIHASLVTMWCSSTPCAYCCSLCYKQLTFWPSIFSIAKQYYCQRPEYYLPCPLLQATQSVRMVVLASSAHATAPLASLERRVRQVSEEAYLLFCTHTSVPVAAGDGHHMYVRTYVQVEYLMECIMIHCRMMGVHSFSF